MAPEVLAGRYNCSCDIWSFGVVAYFLLSGALPVDVEEMARQHQKQLLRVRFGMG